MRKVIIAGFAGALAVFGLLSIAVAVVEELDRIGNRQDYLFEIVRRRQLSPELCEGYSDDQMQCVLNEKKICACAFEPDELDIANQIYSDAVKAAAAQIVAEKKAEEEDESTDTD